MAGCKTDFLICTPACIWAVGKMVVFEPKSRTQPHLFYTSTPLFANKKVDCKTVCIFAYSSTFEQSNKRSGARLKMESETGDRLSLPLHALQACEACALRPALFPVVLGDFGYDVTCQACRENLCYHTRFQASSGNSDSANWPGYEAALRLCETLKPHLTGEKKLFSSLIKEALLWGYTYCVPRLNFKTHCLTF